MERGSDWKLEKVNGLLMQLVHGGAPELAGRLQHCGGREPNGRGAVQTLEQKRQSNDRGVGRHDRRRKEIDGSVLRSQPRGAHHDSSFLIKRSREIEHG